MQTHNMQLIVFHMKRDQSMVLKYFIKLVKITSSTRLVDSINAALFAGVANFAKDFENGFPTK